MVILAMFHCRLVQIQRICRRQNKCNPKIDICFGKGRKHCGKRKTGHLKLTLSETTNLDSSKLKVFAGDNIKLDENGRKFAKRVEITAGKGEIARYEQFLLFP